MAQRRMFSKKITDTDIFLDMPPTSQNLYFHLNMHADDDGFLGNARTIKRMVGASDDDLKILIAKQFVIAFEDGVTVIRDWRVHNYIQKDRYRSTIYTDHKKQLVVDENQRYQRVDEMDAKCIHNVSNMDTQVRLGKVRDRDRLGKVTLTKQDSQAEPDNLAEKRKQVVDYLNQKIGSKYRPGSSATKTHLDARFKDGFTVADCKQVIDKKVAEWGNSPQWSKYLRPATLFGSKFESYLNQPVVKDQRTPPKNNGYAF